MQFQHFGSKSVCKSSVIYNFCKQYLAEPEQLKILVPPSIELQWLPDNYRSHYWIDSCYCPGELAATESPLYFEGQLILSDPHVIVLPPGSGGRLAVRSTEEIVVLVS